MSKKGVVIFFVCYVSVDLIKLWYGKYCGIGYIGCESEVFCDGIDFCCKSYDICIGLNFGKCGVVYWFLNFYDVK